MRDQKRSLAICLALVSPLAIAQDSGRQPVEEAPKRLDELIVTAVPLRNSVESLARPVEILAGAELDARKGNSLGETLSKLTGVQSSYFGPGVGRPIIRGLDGARVQVLSGGVSSQDASTVSADHAVSIEPFLADQIEVLKSASSLLYGSSAIGGAVNVVDGRIPEQLTDSERGFTGRAELRGNTVNDETTGMLRLDGSGGILAFHVDLLRRETDDYEIPGFAESAARLAEEGETPDPDSAGVLENSALTTTSGAFGASLIGERAFFGLSYSIYDTLYGIPGHAEHGHDEAGDEAHSDEGNEEEGEFVRIDMEQKRLDAKFGLTDPLPGHEKLTVRLANNRYTHTELEGEQIGTVFGNRGSEARLEVIHAPLAGWRGAYGVQYGRRDFSAVGEEAFVPPSLSRDLGFFLVEEQQFDQLEIELGARVEQVRIDPVGGERSRFNTTNVSAAGRWDVNPDLHLQIGLDAAERAPVAEELFANGPHLATQTFEIGNPDLNTEKSHRAEFGLHWHRERFAASASLYRVDFDDFIYLTDTGEEEDELPVRVWTQDDARFNGVEVEGKWLLADGDSGRWDLRAFADSVRARLDAGGNLPRIAPARVGADLLWQRDGWRASVGALRYDAQDRPAQGETASAGYTLVDAHVSYSWDANGAEWQVFLDGSNLGDREARPHTSFLKDLAPLPGRSVAFGLRAWF